MRNSALSALEDYLACICVATAAINTGIDKKWMGWMDWIGLPWDEMCWRRCYRRWNAMHGSPAWLVHIIFIPIGNGLPNYFFLFWLPWRKKEKSHWNTKDWIWSSCQRAQKKRRNNIQPQSGLKYPLTRTPKHNNTVVPTSPWWIYSSSLTCHPSVVFIHARNSYLLKVTWLHPRK